MARRADCALCRGNARGCGHALARCRSIRACRSREFALRIRTVSLCRPRRGSNARQTSTRRRLLRLRLRVRAVGALPSGGSGNLAPLRTARRRSALRCCAALRSPLTRAHGMHVSRADATTGRARRASSLVAACGCRVCIFLGFRSRGTLAAWRDCFGRCARLLRGAMRTGSGRDRGSAPRSRTPCGGGLSLHRRNRRPSRASSRRSPSRRARHAGVRAARRCLGVGRVASRRCFDQAVHCAGSRRMRGRRIRLRRNISAAPIVALAHRAGADAGRSADRRAPARISRDRNDARRSFRRRASFVRGETNAPECAGGARALCHHLLPRRCCAHRRSSRTGAPRSRRLLATS